MKVDGIAALERFNQRYFPSLHQPVATERQTIDGAQDKAVARVEVRQPPVPTDVVAVLNDPALNIP